VREAPDKCKTGDVETDVQGWTVITLKPQLDGSMTGEYPGRPRQHCAPTNAPST
jgi:hypothetical protein